jgi:hypothetical protein
MQAQQEQHDLDNWYSQVDTARQTAATRDTAATQGATNSYSGLISNIISSLGGAANEGAGVVGAAGAEALGTMKAVGGIQDQYNADLAPLLAAEAAGTKAQRQAANANLQQDLVNSMASLRGQKGQALAAKLMEIDQYNNQMEQSRAQTGMSINQFNRTQLQGALNARNTVDQLNKALGQQDWANQLGLGTLKMSGATLNSGVAKALLTSLGKGKSSPRLDPKKIVEMIAPMVGGKSNADGFVVPKSGTGVPSLVNQIASTLIAQGVRDPSLFKAMGYQILSAFRDDKGNPITDPTGNSWFHQPGLSNLP